MSVAYFALRVRAVALLGSVPMANEVRPWVPQQPVWGALRTTWPALIAKMRSLSPPKADRSSCCIFLSVFGSMDAVGSSATTMRRFCRKFRAKQRSQEHQPRCQSCRGRPGGSADLMTPAWLGPLHWESHGACCPAWLIHVDSKLRSSNNFGGRQLVAQQR
eukprot:gnl/TRDRNA2_/TRDRNA2_164890_c0_seq5.p2 gnl/TRDRNA2_/TRDRNA2_164890_c0~~gnl/TRDRNA2_/TRDRNA2_164890_c0_seq5.p2  ORF type:complete len:161 (+),score=15.67 gnl/TRDRNA2_/TRDRNA2_164890_c0_seq5:26-508(+)